MATCSFSYEPFSSILCSKNSLGVNPPDSTRTGTDFSSAFKLVYSLNLSSSCSSRSLIQLEVCSRRRESHKVNVLAVNQSHALGLVDGKVLLVSGAQDVFSCLVLERVRVLDLFVAEADLGRVVEHAVGGLGHTRLNALDVQHFYFVLVVFDVGLDVESGHRLVQALDQNVQVVQAGRLILTALENVNVLGKASQLFMFFLQRASVHIGWLVEELVGADAVHSVIADCERLAKVHQVDIGHVGRIVALDH
ncbi:hypothetical protein BpHYR1_029815 [Brachionus plicatilis]|uniref:Uncharacterized protein n=1 Tax=Brachionus plicatilis TaxID=10195 RepID=A0A3M7SFE7_BRAPC|nr:hypothetical protein BpHYR1_029815 [Brachionus plicatilis]